MASKVSYIVSVYKNTAALELIILGLQRQSFIEFELIVAEDNDGAAMKALVESYRQKVSFDIKHVSQKDEGFLKTKALNKAIAVSTGDYIIFTDGDCIPHQHFVKEHYRNREYNRFLYGRRVMLSQQLTQTLYAHKNLGTLNLWNMIINKCLRIEDGLYLPFLKSKTQSSTGVWGCNWSVHKKDLIEINGFDEDFNLAGFGEDTDIEWRLFKKGLLLKKLKNKAIQYHLDHTLNYTDTSKMEALFELKKAEGKIFCDNGLDKHLQSSSLIS